MEVDVDAPTFEQSIAHYLKSTPSDDATDSLWGDVDDALPIRPLTPVPLSEFGGFRRLPGELVDRILYFALVDETVVKLLKRQDNKDVNAMDIDGAGRDTGASLVDTGAGVAEETIDSARSLRACVRNAADPNIVLADRQLANNYRYCADQAMTLEFTDHQDYNFEPFQLPVAMRAVHFVVFSIILFCHTCPLAPHTSDSTCHAAMELKRHLLWITNVLAQMMGLKHFSIYAHVCHDSYKVGDKEKAPCEPWVVEKFEGLNKMHNIRHLVLYRHDHDAEANLEGPKEIIYEWKDGEVIEVEEAAKADGDDRQGDSPDILSLETADEDG